MAAEDGGILAGNDGSPGCERALSWAAREAQARGLSLTVCHAWAPGYPDLPGETGGADLARQGGERVIASDLRLAQGNHEVWAGAAAAGRRVRRRGAVRA
jgi:nucleotide-binding universal stress UspA family protein